MGKELRIYINCSSFDGTPLDGALFIDKIGKKLAEYNITLAGIVTQFREVKDYYDKTDIPCHYMGDFPGRYPIKNLKKELVEIEDKYDVTLEKIIIGDFDYDSINRRAAEEMLVCTFRFWEEVVAKENIDYILGGEQRYLNLVAHAVCKKNKTRYLVKMQPPFVSTISFSYDVRGHSTTLDKYWELNKDKPLTAEETKRVDEYIDSILSHKKKKEAFKLYDTTPRINLKKFGFFFERAYKSFFVEKLRTPYSQPWRGLYNYAAKIIRGRISDLFYDKPNYNEKYIFFPMHIEWDSPVIVWNPLFINQLFLIKIISRSLPSGYKIYIKEHPCDKGGIKIRQLLNFKNTRHVRLIRPDIDSFEIIKNSQAVMVISGTVGWECLLIGKSVINVGKAYYETSGLTWKVNDLSDLDNLIRNAVKKSKYDKETLYRFISCFMKVAYPGKLSFTQLYYGNQSNRDFVLSDGNIGNMALAIKKALIDDAYLLEK